jgi:hypothetical protein
MRLGPVISYIFNGVLKADHAVKYRIRVARV